MKNAFASLALAALMTSCGAANSSAVKAAGLLPGSVSFSGAQARAFALALTSTGVIRQGADGGAFFVRAARVSCTAADACVVIADDVELSAPSEAAATIVATLKQQGAAANIAAKDVNCVTYVNPRVSPRCTMVLAK